MFLRALAAVSAVLMWSAAPIRAAMIVNSGTMHVSAFASNGSISTADNPPDKSISLTLQTDHGASASAFPLFASVAAAITPTPNISIAANTSISSNTNPLANSGASASGTVFFTNATSSSYFGTLTKSGIFIGANVSLRDLADTSLLTWFNTGSKNMILAPGQYKIQWDATAFRAAGSGGPSSATFLFGQGIPEPTGLALFALAIPLLNRRRA